MESPLYELSTLLQCHNTHSIILNYVLQEVGRLKRSHLTKFEKELSVWQDQAVDW